MLDGMPAESAQHLRTHRWLLATMLQLWMGETLALQQAGEQMCKACSHSNHVTLMMIRVCTGNMEDRLEDLESCLRGLGGGCSVYRMGLYMFCSQVRMARTGSLHSWRPTWRGCAAASRAPGCTGRRSARWPASSRRARCAPAWS